MAKVGTLLWPYMYAVVYRVSIWLYTALRLENGLLSRESRVAHLSTLKSLRLPISTYCTPTQYTPGSEGSPAFFDFVLPPPRQQVAHHTSHQLLRELE